MRTERFQKIEDLCTAVFQLETPSISIVDNGVGSYEYWGLKGTDIQLEAELEELDDVRFELFIPKGISLTSAEFYDFITDHITELNDAVHNAQSHARSKESLSAKSYGITDYSNIIKLEYQTVVLTYANSVEVFKLAFIFSWVDGRN